MSKSHYYYRFSKKVRNLTIGNLVRMCKRLQCPNCPLRTFCCFNFQAFEDYLDKKVHVSIKYERRKTESTK